MNPEGYKAVVPDTSPEILSWRLATGKDYRDEVWDGVYHVVDEKSALQLDVEDELETWLITHWACQNDGRIFRDTRLAKDEDWEIDFRVPSLCLYCHLSPTAYAQEVLVEPPDVVVEVFEGEATGTQKADFYRSLGVREIWLIDARNRICEMVICEDSRWVTTRSNHEFSIPSEITGIKISSVKDAPLNGLLGIPGEPCVPDEWESLPRSRSRKAK